MSELYVIYCLLADGRRDIGQRQKLSEALYKAQAYYELKAREMNADYRQAFIFGNGQAVGRPFAEYDFGFRAAMDENVDKYSLTDMLLICKHFLTQVMPKREDLLERGLYKEYRVIWIADCSPDGDGEPVGLAVNKLSDLKKKMARLVGTDGIKFCFLAVRRNTDAKALKSLIDSKELI